MNQEPDAGVVDVDTEEWHVPEPDGDEPDGDEPAAIGIDDQAPPVTDEEGWPEPAGAVAAERVQPRHARPRDLQRLLTVVLGVALVIAVGIALYFWLQAGSAEDATPGSGDLSSRLEQANTRLAETEDRLQEAQLRVVAAEAAALELQEQLDATVAASADADGELAEMAEQLQAVSDSLAAARSQGEALASAVLGSVDPVDACVRAAAQVAENADQVGRGQLARQAGEAAATCAAAQESLAPAVGQAGDVLSN